MKVEFALFLGIVAGLPAAFAQPAPQLNAVSETWLTRGSTNLLTVTGEALADLETVLASGSGVTASLLPLALPRIDLVGESNGLKVTAKPPGNSRQIQLVIATDAEPGPRNLRAAGPAGVSNPVRIEVSEFRELHEPAGDTDEATRGIPILPLPVGYSGVLSKPAESDWFEFSARQGERLIFDVQANRTGSPLDATLVLMDAAGKELARSEDAHGLDPFVDFTAPADGDYTLKLFDLRFQGGADYRYRLVAGALPYVDFLFPFGGRRGETVPLQLEGRNLEGADALTMEIREDAPIGRKDIRARTPRGSSNPLPFEIGRWPETLDREPNDTAATAQAVAAPLVINGRLGRTNDVDFFRWRARSDEKTVVEVRARAFASPLDALLTVMGTNGTVLAQNDDANGLDARLEFDAKSGTDYTVSLRDLTDRGGPRFGYRLAIQPADLTPGFVVRVSEPRPRVHRGATAALRCEVERRNGFDGSIRVTAEGLPAGVGCAPLVLGPAGPKYGWLILNASSAPALGYFPLRLVATAELGGRPVTQVAEFPDDSYVTVLPEAPFAVELGQAMASVEQAGSLAFDVAVMRKPGYTGEIKVVAEEVPGMAIPPVTLATDQSRGKLAARVAYNAEAGPHPLMVRAEASVAGQPVTVHAASAIPVQTDGIPYFIVAMLPGSSFFLTNPVKLSATALPAGSVSVANQTEFVVKVDRRGLAGEIPLTLEGLPSGVSANATNIAANASEAAFHLLVSDRTATGTNHQFRVAATVTHQNRIWHQQTEPITLTVAAPESVAPTTAAK